MHLQTNQHHCAQTVYVCSYVRVLMYLRIGPMELEYQYESLKRCSVDCEAHLSRAHLCNRESW